MAKRHRYRKVLAAVFNSVWAIAPEKLAEIRDVLDLRARGVRLSQAEVRERIGEPAAPPLSMHLSAEEFGGETLGQTSDVETTRIAVLNVFGTIAQRMNLFMEFSGGTSTEQLGNAFDEAVGDESVAAIVLNVDSPGGTVSGVPELADKIFEARGTKPIIAVANPVMASAAYFLAAQADEIVAVPSASHVGSIGVMTIHTETSQADEDAGIRHTIIQSAENKAEGNPFEPLSEKAQRHFQERVDQFHAIFVEAVARGRGVSAETVNENFGRGRSFLAEEAVRRGLADRVATLETVFQELFAAGRDTSTNTTARNQAGAFRIEEQGRMDPKLKAALIQAGLITKDADDTRAEIALGAFLGYHGLERPESAEETVKLIEAKKEASKKESGARTQGAANAPEIRERVTASVLSAPQPEQTNREVSPRDIHAAVNISPLTADAKNELIGELLAAGDSLSYSDMLEKINERAQKEEPPAGAGVDVQVTRSERDKFHAAARDAILVRAWGPGQRAEQIYNHATGGYEDWSPSPRPNYALMSLPKLAEQCLVMSGFPRQQIDSLAPQQIARLVMGAEPSHLGLFASSDGPAYNVSGMFSNILLDAANVMLRRSYDDANISFDQWMRQGPSVPDFKTVNKVIAGELNDPQAVPEDGEFEETTLSDGKETYKLTVWGSIFSHSWQLVVNDRLNSFTEIPMKLGRSMRRKQNRLAYQVLKDNNALADGTNLFASGHSNNTTGAVSDYGAAFSTLVQKMREQTGLDTDSGILNLMPRFVVFPPAIRADILKELRSEAPPSASHAGEANIHRGAYTPIEEGELGSGTSGGSDTAFYMATDPADADTIEYAFLQGLEAPVIEQATAFDRLAIRQRIYQAFAVAAIDHRGLQRHTGA